MPFSVETKLLLSKMSDILEVLNKLAYLYEFIIVIKEEESLNLEGIVPECALDLEKVKIVNYDPKVGKVFTLLRGFQFASGDLIFFIDPALDLKKEDIGKFIEDFDGEITDIIVASKFHPESNVDYPAVRHVLSKFYYWFLKKLFSLNVKDVNTDCMLFKRNVLKNIVERIITKKYALNLEIFVVARHLNYKVKNVPIKLGSRQKWQPLSLFHLYYVVIDVLAIYYRLYILKYYDYLKKKPSIFPMVSIVIPVVKMNEYLKESMGKCLELNYPKYEIIVLPDEKFSFDKELQDEKINIVPTGCVTPPEKRDVGIREAKGEIVAFLDDDALPTKDWIMNTISHFEDERVAAVGGPAVTPASDNLNQIASGAVYSSWLVAGINNYRYIPYKVREVDDYPSCNLFVRKEVLEQIKGFNTKFWPGEDTILCLKIKLLNKKIIYDPGVIVYHHRRELFKVHLKQIKNYALHRGYFVKKYPETSFKICYFIPSLFDIGFILGGILSFFFPCIRGLYFGAVAFYLSLLLLNSIPAMKIKLMCLIFFGIMSTHIVYGIYFIKGLFAKRMAEEE